MPKVQQEYTVHCISVYSTSNLEYELFREDAHATFHPLSCPHFYVQGYLHIPLRQDVIAAVWSPGSRGVPFFFALQQQRELGTFL